MNQEPSPSKPKSSRRQDAETHPVLARLPEVSAQPSAQPRAARAAAGFVDYRFDMPSGRDAESRPRLRVQSPAYKRAPRSDHRPHPFGTSSPALPESNPFAIPAMSMLDRLAPAIRFLTMFLLFTAIGTFVLSSRRERNRAAEEDRAPSAAVPASAMPAGVEQKLEPTSTEDHPTIATPKAFGPLGVSVDSAADEAAKSVHSEPPPAASAPEARTEKVPALAGPSGDPLPQVQTTEMPSTVGEADDETTAARFTGSIESMDDPPSERAARAPAVARLPSIFDAPRNAYQ